MAYLILNGTEPYEGDAPEMDRYYEFDGEDRETINRIRSLLLQRRYGDRESVEKSIVSFCAESMEKKSKADSEKRAFCERVQRFIGKILSPGSKNKTGNCRETGCSNAYACHI